MKSTERGSAQLDASGPSVAPSELDLSICDREPIHIPGSIQPHGFLLALDPQTLAVREASENAAQYLNRPIGSIFGRRLAELFGRVGERLAAELLVEDLSAGPRLLTPLSLDNERGEPQAFEVLAHLSGEGEGARVVVELEEARVSVDIEELNSRLYNFVAANRGNRGVDDVVQAAVTELRVLTGCDRVVLYCFDEEGHGLVLAEDRAEDRGQPFASYLGLRFPASDVPKQARRMYELNRVRIIPDVDYTPSPLLAESIGAVELDLSSSTLRSVSPVHRAYMRNMGTVCSMSVSILIDLKLWGLVSCHHHKPRYVPLRLRAACDFVMQVVAAQIESQQKSEHLRRMMYSRTVQGTLLGAMAASKQYMDGLLQHSGLLMALVDADGVALVSGPAVHLFGVTPDLVQVTALVDFLAGRESDEVFTSSRLSRQYAGAADFIQPGSGLIAANLSKKQGNYVLWFRREVISTVRWAGDPQKPALPEGGDHPLSPRRSFDEWSQIVRAQSRTWTSEQVAAAAEFRSSVLEIVLKRAEELAEMAAGLKVANEELEAFSYSVSHDLRAPFRHISGFSEMLREEEERRMSPKGRHYLQTIMESARFAGQLVDSLLDFSRIARTPLEQSPIDMRQLFDEEWQAVLYDEGRERRIEYKCGPLYRVVGSPALMRQVLRNLMSNAVKYTGKVDEARIEVNAYKEGQEVVFSVKDNGAGFDPNYAGKLFGVFQRLHRMEEFEGTGIGLANVRRIINRHGGRTWAEAEVGKGATFFFSLPSSRVQQGE